MAGNEVVIKIEADSKDFESALNKVTQSTKELGTNVLKGLASFATAKNAVKAIYEVGDAAVRAYADYEQLVGGVDTLFEDSSQEIQRYAANAYKTAGLSANRYMETVTGFSASLIQSLGGDTKKAAKYADMAITDMADNANKMGTAMDSIQNAYQGFAKQNYTMLDNLKLGYGGTKEEMQRLLKDAEALKAKQGEVAEYSIDSYADIVEAIHVVQTEMGITGTTSLEAAETISGSFASAKASVENLLVAMVDTDQDIIAKGQETADALVTAFGNAGPAIANLMTVGIRAIEDAVDPANKVSRAIGEIEEAQERVTTANNILDLVNRYRELQAAAEDSSLSSSEVANIEQELVSVRQQLADATGNAKIAQESSNDEVEQAVEYEQALAEIEKERANVKLYQEISKGAAAYRESMDELKRTTEELSEAEDHYANVSENRTKNQAEEYQRLADKMEALWDGLDDGSLTTEELHAGLDQLAQDVYDLTGNKVEFKDILAGQDYIDDLELSFGALGKEIITSYEEMDDLRSRSDTLAESTKEFRSNLKRLVDAGLVPAEEAAGYLGVSVDQLDDTLSDAEQGTDALTDALEDQTEQVDETTQSLAKVGTKAYEAMSAGDDLRETYEELSKEAEKYTENADAQIAADTELALQRLNLAATTQELGTAYGDMSQTIGLSTSELAGYLVSADMSFEDFQSNATTATSNVINGFEQVTTSLGMSLSTMQSNLEYNIQAQASWNDNMETLWNRAVASSDAGTMALVQKLYDMGVEGAAQVAEFVNLTDEELDEWGRLFAEAGQEGAENAALGAAMAAGSLYNSGAAMGAEFGEGYASTDMSRPSAGLVDDAASGITSGKSKLTASGKNVGAAIVTGLKSQEASLKTSAASLAAAAINVWTAKASTFRSSGVSAAAELATGIGSGSGNVASSASSVIYAAKAAMQIGGWYNLGYNISAGVASGVYGGSSLISAAARSVAQSALSTAKRALGVHSPSRVFRDEVGRMIPAGLAEGIAIGTPKATREVELTADQLLMATQVALRPSGSMMGAQYISNTTSNSYYGSTGGEAVSVEVPVYLDGREIARASTKYTGRRMAYLEGL